MTGLSVVICCHNSAKRLPQALESLALQQSVDFPWELLVIDNASTDATRGVAEAQWSPNTAAPMRVISEPHLGLSHARRRGLVEARYNTVSFIDDDNLVCPEWVEIAAEVMSEHPNVGACGGFSQALCAGDPPWWFEQFQSAYAVGAQGPEAGGDITWTRGYLWGAGLTVRKSAWQDLVSQGYAPVLVDREGGRLSAGGDAELCFALRWAGWRLWYEPRLQLRHLLPAQRLSWSYLRRLYRGFGAASVGHDPYQPFLAENHLRLTGRPGTLWTRQAKAAAAELLRFRLGLVRALRAPQEGNPSVLTIEYQSGRLFELLRQRSTYERTCQHIWGAPWRQVAQPDRT